MPQQKNLPVVILRSNDICFLGILRSCQNSGIDTIPVVFDWAGSKPWYSENSKYFKNQFVIPNPFEFEKDAIEKLVEVGKQLKEKYGEKLLIVPSSDTNLMFIQNHFEKLTPYFYQIGHTSFEQDRLDIINKHSCSKILDQGGVDVPQSFVCNKTEQIENICQKMSYPCVFKPTTKDYGQSFYRKYDGFKAIECNDSSELRSHLEETVRCGFEVLVQEKIIFDSPYEEIPLYIYADKNSEIKMFSSAIKRHIYPFPYGTAVELEICDFQELLETAKKVVKTIEWRGILMLEFIQDKKDSVWKVIEINTRPWLFVDFYRRFGLNYLDYLNKDHNDNELGFNSLSKDFKAPYHIDLTGTLQSFTNDNKAVTIENIESWLTGIEGEISFTLYDPNDPKPGEVEVRDVAQYYKLDEEKLLSLVKKYGRY